MRPISSKPSASIEGDGAVDLADAVTGVDELWRPWGDRNPAMLRRAPLAGHSCRTIGSDGHVARAPDPGTRARARCRRSGCRGHDVAARPRSRRRSTRTASLVRPRRRRLARAAIRVGGVGEGRRRPRACRAAARVAVASSPSASAARTPGRHHGDAGDVAAPRRRRPARTVGGLRRRLETGDHGDLDHGRRGAPSGPESGDGRPEDGRQSGRHRPRRASRVGRPPMRRRCASASATDERGDLELSVLVHAPRSSQAGVQMLASGP